MEARTLTFVLESDSMPRTLRFSGEVDEDSTAALRDALEEHSEAFTRDLVVDLADVGFLPSLGIGVLAGALRAAEERGSRLELVAPKGTIAQQVLSICGLPHTQSSAGSS